MAASAANLALLGDANGFKYYRYDTTDAISAVDADGYFNNTDDALNLKVGDIIDVVVWATAVRTGTISDTGRVIVMQVGSDGDVDLSNDLIAQSPATGD